MRRRHRGSALFYEVEISGTVTSGGEVTSTGFTAGSLGWAIYGDGSVEFNDGEFRGDIVGGSITIGTPPNTFNVDTAGNLTLGTGFGVTNAGVMTATSGSFSGAITGSTIDIGSAPNNFTVDAAGNLDVGPNFSVTNTGALTATDGTFTGTLTGAITATGATVQDGIFNDITANNVTATGTIATASSGRRIEFGVGGNDEIAFYDGTRTFPGKIEVDLDIVRLFTPGDLQSYQVAQFQNGFNQLLGSTTISDQSMAGATPSLTITTLTPGAVGGGYAGLRLYAESVTPSFAEYWDIACSPTSSTDNRLLFYTNSTFVAEMNELGSLSLGGSGELGVGRGDVLGGAWSAYEGVFHKDLADDYMIMSNGTDTFIGGDSNVYIRPGGNTAPDIRFQEDGTRSYVRVEGAGSQSSPHYSFADDTNTGMYRPSDVDDLRFAAGGVAFLRSTSTQTFIYKQVYVSGLSSSSTTAGEPLWHYNAGGDEMYKYTSTGRLKANQRDRPRQEARSILNLRPKLFDAQRMEPDGTVVDLDVGPRDPKQKGQIYDVVGLIAEDVAQDFPDACIYDENGDPHNIDWNAITTSIIGLLQDMDGRLDALERSGGRP